MTEHFVAFKHDQFSLIIINFLQLFAISWIYYYINSADMVTLD